MSEENNSTQSNTQNSGTDNLKSEWRDVGRGLGKTFSGLGKTLVKTAKIGLEKADDWAEGREGVDHSVETQAMKEGWTAFGNNFVDSATDLGKTTVKSVKQGVDACTNDSTSSDSQNSGNTTEKN